MIGDLMFWKIFNSIFRFVSLFLATVSSRSSPMSLHVFGAVIKHSVASLWDVLHSCLEKPLLVSSAFFPISVAGFGKSCFLFLGRYNVFLQSPDTGKAKSSIFCLVVMKPFEIVKPVWLKRSLFYVFSKGSFREFNISRLVWLEIWSINFIKMNWCWAHWLGVFLWFRCWFTFIRSKKRRNIKLLLIRLSISNFQTLVQSE